VTEHSQFSRPARLAAVLTNKTDHQAEQMFCDGRVLLRLEQEFESLPDARETLLFAANQILRFCPNLAVQVAHPWTPLMDDLQGLKREIHGENGGPVERIRQDDQVDHFSAILNIGSGLVHGLPWITVNSSGWVARIATAQAEAGHLFWTPGPINPCAAPLPPPAWEQV